MVSSNTPDNTSDAPADFVSARDLESTTGHAFSSAATRRGDDDGRLSCNIGYTEQKVRLGVGTALVAAAALAPVGRGWRMTLAALGASQLIIGGVRFCPLWHALGIDTRRSEGR